MVFWFHGPPWESIPHVILSHGQFNLAWAYYEGIGVTQSFDKAHDWYLKSAQQNNPKAQYNLGLMYADGIGLVKSPDIALRWLKKAYSGGIEQAGKSLHVLNENQSGAS